MSKIIYKKISNGIYWLDIQDAKLSILCGCPADSVKSLIKKNCIQTQSVDGINFHTGPNVILLSEEPYQKQNICNFAEFPILHMLYMQGMMVPNHPNNDGTKPALYGVQEQIKAQENYIFRGNYGLHKKEEFKDTDIPDHVVDQLLKIKRRFAFGNFMESKELVQPFCVSAEKQEIRNGVYIQRIGYNHFRFEYRGESLSVNLNLSENELYQPPYHLPRKKIPQGHFIITNTGLGDGWDPFRPCFGSLITYNGKHYLVDAGPNILYVLHCLGLTPNDLSGIVHTHGHDDHFAGLASLAIGNKRIRYYSTKLVRQSMMLKLAALLNKPPEFFLELFEPYDLPYDEWTDVEGLHIKPSHSPHPVETAIYMFRVRKDGNSKIYSHFADLCSFDALDKMLNEECITPEFHQSIKNNYLEESDFKKIDIGGGMIHGCAEDFKDDKSKKLVLGHTSGHLTLEQLKVGDSEPFGFSNILIKERPFRL